jgi:ABC-type multidrug transport system fused ATPase/permease subunit
MARKRALSSLGSLTALLAGPLLYTIIRKLGKRIKKASKAVLVSQGALYASATSTVQGLRAVKVNTAERLEAGRFHRINKRTLREMNRVRTARALASPLTEMLSIFLLCGLVLVTGYFIIRRGVFDPGVFIMVISSLAVAGASLKPLTGIVNDIQASAPAADRIAELLAAAPEKGHDRRLPKLLRHAKAIEFRQVSLQYENAPRPAIDGVSITIPHGRRIAVVGPNGCGKTSLLSLVPRLFAPSSGSVLIDDVDISTVSLRSLRAQIGVVTQETTLFRGTIRENIAYGAEGVTDDRVIDAARRAHAHEFIMSLPLAYETEVAEQGLSLSGGQRQRLSIARAILRDPAILILDEATSMIDAESEAHIGAALNEFSQGRTCLIVAHRLATVVNADRIMVMDSGKIVDSGTHAELLTRCETYRSLVQHQFGIVLGASGNIESEFGRFAAAGTNGTGLVEPAIVPTMM